MISISVIPCAAQHAFTMRHRKSGLPDLRMRSADLGRARDRLHGTRGVGASRVCTAPLRKGYALRRARDDHDWDRGGRAP
jgi:hypothetical protein